MKSAKQGVDKAQVEIDELKKEKAALERENAELKLLVSSKRFRLANKMGNAFNSLFPVSSRRRVFERSFLHTCFVSKNPF